METNSNENKASSSSGEQEDKFLEFEEFKQFYDKFSTTLKETVQSSNNLFKNNDDLNYYLSFPGFVKSLKTQNTRLLKLVSSLLKFQALKKPNQICSNELDVDEKVDLIIDANDQLIERLGIQLDEIEGLRKKTETELKLTTIYTTNRNINTSWNKETGMVQRSTASNQLLHKRTIQKPQEQFADKINNSNLPFVPKIRVKANAIEGLAEIFTKLDTIEMNEKLFQDFPELLINPYIPEIDAIQVTNMEYFGSKEPIKPLDLDETELEYIDTVEALTSLARQLSNRDEIKEIAVDLEHHNHRSYLGFTCLMQISTRFKDYIIDSIKLRSSLHMLNDLFTDPTLLKVFHGSESDIEWLQKDFGIYVVNLFDTGQASRLLQYPHFSLSFLLKKFCDVQAQKQYQMSDWRQRPLSAELINYAREDTHYLLYIYDHLRNDLVKQGAQQLQLCFEKSKLICKKTYKKPVFYSNSYLNLCSNSNHLSVKQLKALELLYEWRDRIARENDESCEYVLKNHQLLKIAELLPREIYGILALCNPVSHLVENSLHQIHELVTSAREFKGDSQTQLVDGEKQQQHTQPAFIHLPLYDPNSILNCPHDSAHKNEDMDVSVGATGGKTKLKDLLLKADKVDLAAPENMTYSIEESTSMLLVDNFKELLNKNSAKRKVKLTSKVDVIRKSMKNPFEKYLPSEYRRSSAVDEDDVWTLIQASTLNGGVGKKQVEAVELVQPKVQDLADDNVIPLKVQIRQQQKDAASAAASGETTGSGVTVIKTSKKMKAMIKELELGNAIVERNRMRELEDEASGDALGNDEQSNAIAANLAIIAAAATSTNTTTQEEFSYDQQNINKLFNNSHQKNNRNEYDPSSKLRNVKNGRVNKQQQQHNNRKQHNFNQAASISRSKNNQSATFKKQ